MDKNDSLSRMALMKLKYLKVECWPFFNQFVFFALWGTNEIKYSTNRYN